MSFVEQYLGDAWVHGEHDCWGFFRRVQREQFGRDVPVIDVDAFNLRDCIHAFTGNIERTRWAEVSDPQNGDAVLMSQSQRPTHVGVWVDGAVLHCVRGSGVVYTSLATLRNFPYNVLGFYRAQ